MSRNPAAGDERASWVWLSLIPLGLGAWAPIYAGTRVGNRRWSVLGVLWSVAAFAGWVLAIVNHGGAGGGLLIILGWAGAIATSFAIRAPYRQLVSSPFDAAVQGAQQRLTDRANARRLARDRPELAREMGIGRPDLADAQDAGLIDVNNVSEAVLTQLPGVDDALAARIVKARADIGGFTAVEDLGLALDLDGNIVEGLRERVVFLPR